MKKFTVIGLAIAAVIALAFASAAFSEHSTKTVGPAVKGPESDLYYIYGEERASDGDIGSYWKPAAKPVRKAAAPRR